MALHLKTTTFLCGLLLAAGALAQQHGNTIQTVEQADASLAQVKQERAATEAEFSASEAVCYTKFFVNNCLDKAKETRRVRLADVRAREIEANYFKRKNAVDIRDRELEDRAQRDAAEQADHAPKPHANPADRAAPVPQKVLPAQRQAEHDARVKQRDAAAAAKAGERAQNVKDFEAKQAESAERQQRVADKAAERAARQARRAADAAAKAAADAEKAKQKAQTK